MTPAPAWGRSSRSSRCRASLCSCAKRLDGATMQRTAIQLRNRFATDGDLGSVLQEAREVGYGLQRTVPRARAGGVGSAAAG